MITDSDKRMAHVVNNLAEWLAERSECPKKEVGYVCPHKNCLVRTKGCSSKDCWIMAGFKRLNSNPF